MTRYGYACVSTKDQKLDRQIEALLNAGIAYERMVGLGVHHGVHDLLGESAKQLLHVDGAVIETGHGEHVRRRV